jgi:6-phosphogluconolactonase
LIETFPDAAAAAEAAADAIARQLSPPGEKRIVVTGGRSPGPVYDRLAAMDLGWERVTVTLSDDRFVAADSPDSNERLVRERLLRDHASSAALVPLRGRGATPEDDAKAAEPRIRALKPFDAVLLGMGDDGHIASLFPGSPGLAAALDPDGSRLVIGVETAGQPPYLPRISLAAAALLDTGLVIVLVSGDGKRALIERVATDPDFAPPVSAVLRQTRAPARVLWSPA